jgi:hypothetical protein
MVRATVYVEQSIRAGCHLGCSAFRRCQARQAEGDRQPIKLVSKL